MAVWFPRRSLFGIAIGAALTTRRRARAGERDAGTSFDAIDLTLERVPGLARRALVLVPKNVAAGERLPVLVLLHGLGETTSEALGIRAWVDRYGLLTSHDRLAEPPVSAASRRRDLPEERARAINDELRAAPYDGRTVIVCPFTPNVWRTPDPRRTLDRYAAWIGDDLLPAVRSRTPATDAPLRTGIDGCSLGGFVGLEVFLRRPENFGVWGGVQSAFGEAQAPAFASRIAEAVERVGPRHLHVETSLGDAFYRANTALARELEKRRIAHTFSALPGPHDQPWLREAGTLEMLLWQDRALRK